jgi:hypothetical protein
MKVKGLGKKIEGWGKYRIPGEEKENILFLKGERANNYLFLNTDGENFHVTERGKGKIPYAIEG